MIDLSAKCSGSAIHTPPRGTCDATVGDLPYVIRLIQEIQRVP